MSLSDDRPTVLALSGPNLNLLGEREPEVYGTATLAEIIEGVEEVASTRGLHLEHHQTNSEAEMVAIIQEARGRVEAIIINPGAFTHYAYAIHDALAMFEGVIVELHLSNPAAREHWRRTSVVASAATASITGFGAYGYVLAIDAVSRMLAG
ncbi:MAG TPA: type II 3-dehydroquinate dehydratase [Acidimicrobiales bacterium]|nr:type II 3-dehydroquinate dehydratase [Acidimicrobiales bacterium]